MEDLSAPVPRVFNSVQTPHRANVRIWDGNTRHVDAWDALRKDQDLWMQDGNCLVYLYAKGQSQRGPSFQIPMQALKTARCTQLLALTSPVSNWPLPENGAVSQYELYLPAPLESLRQEVFRWHITTRNVFAWMCGKPLIGEHLGQSLCNLLERIVVWRELSANNIEDVLVYTDTCGYSSVGNCPDHALAMLYFAEEFELKSVWIDAFAHCVGMNDILLQSSEYEPTSRITKALITRAYLEMDLHLSRATPALNNFLEDELSSTHVGLTEHARVHLDNFRSFLYSYYVAKHGYWPPPQTSQGSVFPRSLYHSMYLEFRNLYDFLADKESSTETRPWRSSTGGICVLQNIAAFDSRQRFQPLPYALPLLPQERSRTESQRSLRSFAIGSRDSRLLSAERTRTSLRSATNRSSEAAYECPLVQRYMTFEDEYAAKPDAKVTLADARKVRWILVYGMLQMVAAMMQAPAEVRNTKSVDYPLCVLAVGIPPWKGRSSSSVPSNEAPTVGSQRFSLSEVTLDRPDSPAFSIHPDCETSDYFSRRPKKSAGPESLRQPNNGISGTSDSRNAAKDLMKLRRFPSLKRSTRNASRGAQRTDSKPSDLVSGRTLAELASYLPHVAQSRLSASDMAEAMSAPNSAGERNFWKEIEKSSSNPSSDESLDEHSKLVPLDDPCLSLFDNSETSSIPSLTSSLGSHETTDSNHNENSLSPEFEPVLVANIAQQRVPDGRPRLGKTESASSLGSSGLYILQGQGSSRSISSEELPLSVTKGYEAIRAHIMSSSSSLYSASEEA